MAQTRIAIVGDSISHGSSGDYTWRYFLDRHLESAGAQVDLVGGHDHLYDLETSDKLVRSYEYVDPDFDTHHAAMWGNSLVAPDPSIPSVMIDHVPDVLVLGLGTNDLAWWRQTPRQVLELLERRIAEARAADPSVDVVVIEVTAVGIVGASAYNDLLRQRMPQLSTVESRTAVAKASLGFVTSTETLDGDTWDAAHPDTSGSVKIAAAVADALATLGVAPTYPRPLVVPPDGLRQPSLLDGAMGADHVGLWWIPAPGATSHDVWAKDLTAGTPSVRLQTKVQGTMASVTGLTPGHTYEFRILSRKYLQVSQPDRFSNAATIAFPQSPTPVPPAPTPAAPTLPGQVPGVRVDAGRHRLVASWPAQGGATSYLVSVRDLDAGSAWQAHETTATDLVVDELRAGAQHEVRVQARNAHGIGEPSVSATVAPTGPRPKAPRRLRADDRPGTDVLLTWARVRHATRHVVQFRRDRGGARWHTVPVAAVRGRRALVAGLRKGEYVFRITPFHDALRGLGSASTRTRVT